MLFRSIYSPDDGRQLGLEGMITDVVKICSTASWKTKHKPRQQANALGESKDIIGIARAISLAEKGEPYATLLPAKKEKPNAPVFGITGTGGAGKSSVTDELVRRFIHQFTDKTIAVISVDPSRKKTGGALLGDRIQIGRAHV